MIIFVYIFLMFIGFYRFYQFPEFMFCSFPVIKIVARFTWV